ncbi:MAG: TetR family transcriptional regulator C-terminal domain-containing protein [Paracoccaceae bacterium]|nr:TetR family transcriptional regulator C-terminal domain-containing protein [Paracoccaceae bacterium]
MDGNSRVQKRNRSAILAAALDVFSQHGYRGATLDQIASAAGMSKPNLLYYFPGKEAVFVQLLHELVDKWLEPLRQLNADGDPLEEIRTYVRRKVQMSQEMPQESRLFANEIVQGAPRMGTYLSQDLKELFDEKTALLSKWMDEGRIARMDPQHLIFSIWATTQHYADFEAQIHLLSDPGTDVFQSAAEFLDNLYVRLLTP